MRFYVGLIVGIFALTLLVAPRLGGGILWNLLNGVGFVALILMLALFGDTGRGGRLALHRALGWSALGLILLHAVGIFLAHPTSLEYLEPSGPLYMGAGLLSALLLWLVLWSASPKRRPIWGGFRPFLRAHWLLSSIAVLGALYHIVASGLYLDNAWEAWAFCALALGIVALPRLGARIQSLRGVRAQHIVGLLTAGLCVFVLLKQFS